MISLEDCVAFCGLTEEQVLAIAEHERIVEIVAAAFAQCLLFQEHGVAITVRLLDGLAAEIALGVPALLSVMVVTRGKQNDRTASK